MYPYVLVISLMITMTVMTLSEKALEILVFLNAQKENRYADLYRRFNLKSSSLKKCLKFLREYGLITRPKRGLYALTDSGLAVSNYLTDTKLEPDKVAKASNSKLKRTLISHLVLLGPSTQNLSTLHRALVNAGVVSRSTMTPIYRALKELIDLGFLERTERGIYSLTNAGNTLFEFQTLIWPSSSFLFPNLLKRFTYSKAFNVANGYWCVHGFLDYQFELENPLILYRKFRMKFIKEIQKLGFIYRLGLGSVDLLKLVEPNFLVHIVLGPPVNFIVHTGIPSITEGFLLEGGELRMLIEEEKEVTGGVPRYLRSPKARKFDLSPSGVGPFSWAYCVAKGIESTTKLASSKIAMQVSIDSLIVGAHNMVLDLLRNVARRVILELGYKPDSYKENTSSFTSVWEAKPFFEIRKFSDLVEYRALLIEKYKARKERENENKMDRTLGL